MMSVRQKNIPVALAVFGLTLFLSAALMFAIEPMIGKMLLPLTGGTPSGWSVALAFFQIMLLLGYLLAHLLSRFPVRVHVILYIAILGAGLLFLPVRLPAAGLAGNLGPLDIFRLLTVAAAVPFIALSATSSTLQRLFAAMGHASSEDPYFLYSASNFGSFSGLFLYTLAIDPALGLSDQAQYWLYGFVALMALAVSCLTLGYRGKEAERHAGPPRSAIPAHQRLRWILLAFFPSSLLLGVTTHISTDMFSAPLIWILPLAIYLLTFVIAFSRRPPVKFGAVVTLQPFVISLAVALLVCYHADLRTSWYAIAFHLAAFGTIALMCHMRLAQERPLGNDRGLTEFYLMISVGGALGGLLNAFLAPVIFDRLVEYPAMLIFSCLVNPAFQQKMPQPAKRFFVIGMAGVALYVIYVKLAIGFIHGPIAAAYTIGMRLADILAFLIAVVLATNVRTVFCGTLALFLLAEFIIPRDVRLTERNFYGIVKVFDRPQLADGKTYTLRIMLHGDTYHGYQIVDPKYEKTPTTYYWSGGPVGDVFDVYKPKKIAVVGLGTGTLNCYSNRNNEFTFIEIDPAVIRIAQDPAIFTFLSACKARRSPRIIAGDGRLELARLGDEKFDLIVLDAFSSDAIPTHLLTLEAVKVYLNHLAPKGILLFHISNRYFELSRILAVSGRELGLKSRYDMVLDKVFYATPSKWFAMARTDVSLAPLDSRHWKEITADPQLSPWTDDHTNLLGALKLSGFGDPVE